MSVRISINDSTYYKEFVQICDWMVEKFGTPEEEVTWFWCTECYEETGTGKDYTESTIDHGVRIWKNAPNDIMVTALRWS